MWILEEFASTTTAAGGVRVGATGGTRGQRIGSVLDEGFHAVVRKRKKREKKKKKKKKRKKEKKEKNEMNEMKRKKGRRRKND